jgi:hypothetical protein
VAWILALGLHTFFIINNVLLFLEYYGHMHSFLRITGIYSSIFYSPSQILIIALNTVANLFITGYLFRKKRYFYPDAIKPSRRNVGTWWKRVGIPSQGTPRRNVGGGTPFVKVRV